MSNTNPYPVGSDGWHRFNLGLSKDVIGQVLEVQTNDAGVEVKWVLYNDNTFRVDDEYICELGDNCPFREDPR